jgi:hypothetical protein
MSSSQMLLLSFVMNAVVGALGLLVARQEHRRGSRWWVVPGVFGALVLVLCFLRLFWVVV